MKIMNENYSTPNLAHVQLACVNFSASCRLPPFRIVTIFHEKKLFTFLESIQLITKNTVKNKENFRCFNSFKQFAQIDLKEQSQNALLIICFVLQTNCCHCFIQLIHFKTNSVCVVCVCSATETIVEHRCIDFRIFMEK